MEVDGQDADADGQGGADELDGHLACLRVTGLGTQRSPVSIAAMTAANAAPDPAPPPSAAVNRPELCRPLDDAPTLDGPRA